MSRSVQLGTDPTPLAAAWEAAEPLIRACLQTCGDERLSAAERRAFRQTTQRLIGKTALRRLTPEQAVQFVLAADREISLRLDREDAHAA